MAQKPILKKYRKSRCPPYGWIGQFSPELIQMITQQPLLLLKPQRKLFLSLLFSNQKHAAKQLQSRDIFQGRCHVTQSNHSSTTNIDAAASRIFFFFFFVIIDLHFMAKWRSPSFKYRRGFDQLRTPRRCSYFQFVSFPLSNHSKY